VRIEMMNEGARSASEFALDGLADDPQFLGLLRAGGIETIHTLETTLEDVFIQVTGRRLA
jgi:fluoroquinolone transport system ATP-binding protein